MRMRQLGKGQSVMFFAPGEVDRRIRDFTPEHQASAKGIRVIDILRWVMHETCEDIAHHLPHWAQQGVDHHRRFSASKQYRLTKDPRDLEKAWLQPESRTLEQMYDPVLSSQSDALDQEINKIPPLREQLERLRLTQLKDVRMAEEQEREVNHEVERERQVERPPKVLPARHRIHDDIHTFIRTGKYPDSPTGIVWLLQPTRIYEALVKRWSSGNHDTASTASTAEWPLFLFATADFAITTKLSCGENLTDYLRPVNWIVSSGFGENCVAVAISPYEANVLLPEIRKSDKVRLHLYAPRVTFIMRTFSDLTFHTVPDSPGPAWTAPAHFRTELNLFAGQLYFDNREEYERVCTLLALHMAHPGAEKIDVDGFVRPEYRTGAESPFSTSVIATFKELTALRRKGMAFDRTHLGRVLDARSLSNEF